MAVNLQKGQKVDLTKSNPGLKQVVVGLGWDVAAPKGLFARKVDIDCDASVIVCDENGKLLDGKNINIIYFGNLSHSSGAITHMGDNLTGEGDGDDEQILVQLDKLPEKVHRLVFIVNIYSAYERKQHFGMINNAFIRIFDAKNGQELCKYNLSENYNGMTAMIFGEMYRHNGEWKFNAIGQGTTDGSIKEIAQKYK